MSDTKPEDTVKEQEVAKHDPEVQVDRNVSGDDLDHSEQKQENAMPSTQEEEETIKKKYGGLLPKKQPLISKDHERAFFDSADWALGKQGAGKPKGPLEALRPKLQPTQQNQARSRRSAYAPADNEDDGGNDGKSNSEE
ncbi:hypothetical protein ACHQM5_006335 [Ranunculus cassubicifolius]